MSAVVESWRGSPFTQLRRRSFCGSISSAVTSHGPSGRNPAAALPLLHWPPDSSRCQVRSERSFAATYPAITSAASAGDSRYAARAPITTPSSTSQSVFSLRRGMSTWSNGPTTVFDGFRNRIGISGGGLPDSAAWAT